jgi:CDP-diacylglycerol--glycerol-3-phosphate 3-phosphatidyltransferase
MSLFQRIRRKHTEMFTFMEPKEVLPHDYFMSKTFLRLLPGFITPNQITVLRIALTPMVFYLVLKGDYAVGAFAFLCVAFTDAMDGSLARTKKQVTKFGMMFDPLADKFLIGSMILLLVFEYFSFWLGIAILGIEIAFILSAAVSTLKFKTVKMANVWGKIKMFLQVFAVFLTMISLLFSFPALLTIAYWIFGIAIGFALVSLFYHGV